MTAKQPLKIFPLPMEIAWKDPTENLRRMRSAIEAALTADPRVSRDALLFVFPELCLTGFVTENPWESALTRDSESVRSALEMARDFGVGIVFGFPERREGAVQNTALLVDGKGKVVGDYQKLRLFTQGKTPESATYVTGDGPRTADYRGWRLGFGICFDIRFPELFIEYRKRGCDALIIPACWVGGPTKSEQFQTLARSHAIVTQSFVVAVNRAGRDPHFEYEAEALVYGPRGEALLVERGKSVAVELDPDLLAEARKMRVRDW